MFRIAVIGLVLSIILGAQHAIAQSSVAEKKRALIVELLEVTEASNVGIQVGTAMLKQLTPVFTKQFGEEKGKRVSQIFREKWAVVVKENVSEFLDPLVAVYHQHYTADEIRDLVTFYRTPTGRKTIALLPKITQASISAGQDFGKKITPIVIERVKQRVATQGLQ